MFEQMIKELEELVKENLGYSNSSMTESEMRTYCSLSLFEVEEIVKKYEVKFHNYEMYSDLLEENEKLKEEIKLLNETSLNEEYWKVLELFQKECETNFELRKQIALLPNDLNGETVELIREKGSK